MELGTYFLGATIVAPQVVHRVSTWHKNLAFHLKEGPKATKKEVHMTLVPPFQCSFAVASRINLGCAMSTLLSSHPLVTTVFEIKGLERMQWGDETIVYFPVTVAREDGEAGNFISYVNDLREKILEYPGASYKGDIPENFLPHITCISVESGRWSKGAYTVLAESNYKREPTKFLSAYPTLYAKYPDGWRDLSDDPAKYFKEE